MCQWYAKDSRLGPSFEANRLCDVHLALSPNPREAHPEHCECRKPFERWRPSLVAWRRSLLAWKCLEAIACENQTPNHLKTSMRRRIQSFSSHFCRFFFRPTNRIGALFGARTLALFGVSLRKTGRRNSTMFDLTATDPILRSVEPLLRT